MIHTDLWIDAQKMHFENPDSFICPTENELKKITVGASVKISNGRERFYVIVKKVKNSKIIGKVNNIIVLPASYKFKDLVSFKKEHVFEIHLQEDKHLASERLRPLVKDFIDQMVSEKIDITNKSDFAAYFESKMNIKFQTSTSN